MAYSKYGMHPSNAIDMAQKGGLHTPRAHGRGQGLAAYLRTPSPQVPATFSGRVTGPTLGCVSFNGAQEGSLGWQCPGWEVGVLALKATSTISLSSSLTGPSGFSGTQIERMVAKLLWTLWVRFLWPCGNGVGAALEFRPLEATAQWGQDSGDLLSCSSVVWTSGA